MHYNGFAGSKAITIYPFTYEPNNVLMDHANAQRSVQITIEEGVTEWADIEIQPLCHYTMTWDYNLGKCVETIFDECSIAISETTCLSCLNFTGKHVSTFEITPCKCNPYNPISEGGMCYDCVEYCNLCTIEGCKSCKYNLELVDGKCLCPKASSLLSKYSNECESTCGDGLKYLDEYCDDGNNEDGDGCSSICQVEDGYQCTGGTVELPDNCICIQIGRASCRERVSTPV